jgi:acyl-CoA dehydrogenase
LDRLTRHIYVSKDPEDITGRLEVAFNKAYELETLQKKFDTVVREGKIKMVYGVNWIEEAEKMGIFNREEADELKNLQDLVEKALAVDHFDPKEIETGLNN